MFKSAGEGVHVFGTWLGPVGLAWTPRGVCRLEIGHPSPAATREALAGATAGLKPRRPLPAAVRTLTDRLRRHLKNGGEDFADVPVDMPAASAFARRVYRELRQVPAGETVTYGELARRSGRPRAARAVGRIMGANPVPVIVPCHRCVAADGRLSGYSAAGGTELKARLLHAEGHVRDPEHAAGIAHLVRVDRRLAPLIRRIGPYRAVPDTPRPDWDTLVIAIVHQQLSVKAGQTIAGRVRALTPGPGLPTPDEILDLPPEKLRACGLSNAKVGFVRDLAGRVVDGRLDLRALHRLDDDAVVAELTKVKGIGEWSAHMHLIFHLGRLDVLPVGDLGIRMAAARVYGLEEYATPAQLREIAEPWRPYRSMGSWYLWRALDSGGLKD
jgi:DNA-3-methyladenine glycosylase II